MSGETIITIIGNLTADPEVRQTGNGAEVASYTIASTPRVFDRQTNEWKDGETLFMRCSQWRQIVAAKQGLWKGLRVIARGEIRQRSYTNKQDQKVTYLELNVSEIGPVLLDAAFVQPGSQPDAWSAPPATQAPPQGGGWNAPAGQPATDPNPPWNSQADTPF